ncbi:MAG: helicase [Nitrospinaceae bacterium]
MPRLNKFKVTIETGDPGKAGPVLFTVNNHQLPLENTKGGVGPGETFEGGFEVNSFAHSLTLVGPESGQWNIKTVKVDYVCEHSEPYSVRLGEVTLDGATELNIWNDPPIPAFDV